MKRIAKWVVGWLAVSGRLHGVPGERGHTHGHTGNGAGRGRQADSPTQIPAPGWKDIGKRVKRELTDDNTSFLAAGVAFYGFFAVFPALAALIAIYGLIADPADVQKHLLALAGALPEQAKTLLADQMKNLVAKQDSALGLGVVFGILLALWSANKGMSGLVKALNVTYDEKERRGFVKLTAVTLSLTVGAVLLVLVSIGLIVALPPVLSRIGLSSVTETLFSVLRWPLLGVMVITALAVVYRYAPSREKPRWRWVTWGSGIATALWILVSLGFSLYASRFGSFDKTYGSLAAVIVLLTWLNLSAYVVLLGAEINAEMEHQTAKDTTAGKPRALGTRGAYVADTVGEAH